MTFDRNRKLAEHVCGCGEPCGLTFTKGPGQRSRMFAPGCPFRAEQLRQKACEYSQRQEQKRKALNPKQHAPGRRPADYTPTKRCGVCCGLAHRRPKTGCPRCKEPFSE